MVRGVQGGEGFQFRWWRSWGGVLGGDVLGGQTVERQTLGCGAVREQRDKSLRGEVQRIFLQFEFRFRNGVGRTYTCFAKFPHYSVDNCKILAKFCTMQNKNQMKKNPV